MPEPIDTLWGPPVTILQRQSAKAPPIPIRFRRLKILMLSWMMLVHKSINEITDFVAILTVINFSVLCEAIPLRDF